MKKIDLGGFSLDLEKLIDTRLLIQANSGGGKSWVIRKLLEETHGKVQQIVLDIEGEFGSLREKYDYILAGKGGDIPASPRSAELLARKALELNSDLICDLYELKSPERILFVKNFLESMINAPKNLWKPVLVVLDEAHIFAPEKGQSQALSAVIDMATRGRKRGFSILLATQRLSKLHKDAAAECNNKMIGRTGLDIDVKRACDELGITGHTSGLRTLEPGSFYVYGPAFAPSVNLQKVGKVETKHPQAGRRGFKHAPAPTAHVKKLLKAFEDLPKEAEAEIQDKTELQKKVRSLEQTLKLTGGSVYGVSAKDKALMQKKAQEVADIAIERHVKEARKQMQADLDKKLKVLRDSISVAINKVTAIQTPKLSAKVQSIPAPALIVAKRPVSEKSDSSLGACERKILGFLKAKFEDSFSKIQVGAMTGYAHSSGGFNNALSRLGQLGFISRGNGRIQITPEGLEVAVDCPDHKLEDWVKKLGACERKIYQCVLESPNDTFTKNDIAINTGYSEGSGGFNNAISRLSTLGLIEREHGLIKLNEELLKV